MLSSAHEIQRILEEGGVRFADRQHPAGRNLAAYCPFHSDGQERHPSFFVYVGPPAPRKYPGMGFCHTCGEGWGLGTLVAKLGISSAVADTIVEMAREEEPPRRDDVFDLDFDNPVLPEVILGAWEYAPLRLLHDGFTKPTLKRFEIGFDRKHQRITFPIRDHLGNLIGVSGRSVTGEMPRYKVYRKEFNGILSGYQLDKSKALWGLDKFYDETMHGDAEGPVIVCEGFKACMWVYQCGYPLTVSMMGTYCSPHQTALLTRITNEVILFLDNDRAGKKATYGVSNYLNKALKVSIANYPEVANGYSPDDLGKDIIDNAVTNKLTTLQWRKKWQ